MKRIGWLTLLSGILAFAGTVLIYGQRFRGGDLANYWDWIDRRIYPLKPSVEAFRLGINFVVYSMTR